MKIFLDRFVIFCYNLSSIMKKIKIKIDSEEPVYAISVVSRLVKIPVWTLRVLDRKGLVSPKRTKGKTRLYCLRDIEKLSYIRYLMEEKGVNIEGIRLILEMKREFLRGRE